MRPPSTKHKVGQLRARLNEFEKRSGFAKLGKTGAIGQKAFANLIGTTEHTVVSLEIGRLKLSRKLAWDIARATGVGLRWLLDGNPKSPIVNFASRPYTKKDFEQATKRSGQKEFAQKVTNDYAVTFYADIRAILSNAIKSDLAEVATRRIKRFLDQCHREFDPNFELREKREFEQALLTPAQQAARIRKRDAKARAHEKRIGPNSTRRPKRKRH
jgi:DNA-binding XRE family transcriptional regulator